MNPIKKADTKFISKYIMEIMALCGGLIIVFMPEIAVLLESVK
tara:strand:+ start:6098 stop:6226 length:129 start_codon:yes stop_codon:yes gene_type:complete